MTYNLYSVRDLKLGFGPVVTCANDEIAKRQFGYMLQEKPMCDYPQDFDMCRIGTFDVDDGEIKPQLPSVVITGGQADGI